MTALAGAVGVSGARPLSDICRQSLEAQSLYGRRGIRIAESGSACFGIDLFETLPEDDFDAQPLLGERFLLVADVRLDNRDELIAAIGDEPSSRSWSDSDVLQRAWERWQEECIPRLEGDFAIAVYDRRSDRLTLARDPLGSRPLCFAELPGLRLFASMPSGLLGPVGLRHNLSAFASHMLKLRPDHSATCFEGVHAVMPGETLQFVAGSRQATRRMLGVAPTGRASEARLIEEFRHALDRAVTSRLRSRSASVATHLSSGYDSSAVTATAAGLRGEWRLLALTSAPSASLPLLVARGRIADESGIAAATASFLAIDHQVVRDGRSMFDGFHGHARYFQEPVANPMNQGWWLATHQAAAAGGVAVLLSAEAGNLTISFGGLPVLAHWVRHHQWGRWWHEARAAVRANDVRWRGVLMASFGPILPKFGVGIAERLFRGIPPDTNRLFIRQEWQPGATRGAFDLTGDALTDRLNLLDNFNRGIQRKGLLARSQVDERDPTSDRRLVEFALSIPPEHLLSAGQFRPLARKALADRVPEAVLDLPVRGFQGADWFGRFDRQQAMRLLESIEASATAAGFLDTARIRQCLADWPSFDPAKALGLYARGRALADALSVGSFIVETERNPESMGR